jgi:hypothetical protein
VQTALLAPTSLAAIAWLWFLARGHSHGRLKRALLRLTLVVLIGGLTAIAAHRGLLTEASLGLRAALLVALVTVAIGYLYLIRFCGSCGRMVRNLKDPTCPRCGAWLPRHGMTARLRRPGDHLRRNPLEKPQRPGNHPDGPRA